MIVRRLIKNNFPGVTLCGLSLADAQGEFLSVHDDLVDDVECVVCDDLPLFSNAIAEKIRIVCLRENVGFRLRDGFIRPKGFTGELLPISLPETKPFSLPEYSFFTDVMRRRILRRHANNGVLMFDENSVFIDFRTKIGEQAIIRPFVTLENAVVGKFSFIGEGSVLRNAVVGENCEILHSTLFDCHVGNRVHIGPYAFLRQNACVSDDCRVGDFVEIKNSTLFKGVKAAHLAYIGDASVGKNTNVGCGTVFCNYDGVTKHKTTVGENVFIGANTNLVAPLTVGNGAFLAAGGTVTTDVPDNTFVIGRSRSTIKQRKPT